MEREASRSSEVRRYASGTPPRTSQNPWKHWLGTAGTAVRPESRPPGKGKNLVASCRKLCRTLSRSSRSTLRRSGNCPNKLSSSTTFLHPQDTNTQTQDTLRRLGRPTAILGRRWDGLKRKKPLQSLVWDGGTAGTGGGGVCHLPIAALDTKLPSFKTMQ